ncbi:unnamed protein product [Acanthocheilonema viteae]|uniref:Uncharacterized protein n=1 Tax=Acanthocheilonema viteae TaxID=6277 RepID=A0A498SWM0_ACAVI|nr:unnamed protein product [Acanthocheilonema viteae]
MFSVVFRGYRKSRNDADDVETAQSSHQLTEDKKDVALETELETRTPSSSIIGSKPGAFVKPSPTFPTFSAATLSPTYGPLPLFYPFFLPVRLKKGKELKTNSSKYLWSREYIVSQKEQLKAERAILVPYCP